MIDKKSQGKSIVITLYLLIFLIVVLAAMNIVAFMNRRDDYYDSNKPYTIDQDGSRIYAAEVYEKAENLKYDDKQGIKEMIEILSHNEIKEFISDWKKVDIPNLVCSYIGLNTGGYPVQEFQKFSYGETETSLVSYSKTDILYALNNNNVYTYDADICSKDKILQLYDSCNYERVGYNSILSLSTTYSELIPNRYENISLQDLYTKFKDSSADFICEINH